MKLIQSYTFGRSLKNLSSEQLIELTEAIQTIQNNPLQVDQRKSELTGVRLYRFSQDQSLALAYLYDQEKACLSFIDISFCKLL